MNDISKNFTCNESIKEKEVRVIDSEGNQLGILQTKEALRMADESELDLVMISPNAKPPVCKIMDLGKYIYEQAKKEKEAKKKQKVTVIKEIRCGITIEENDVVIKKSIGSSFFTVSCFTFIGCSNEASPMIKKTFTMQLPITLAKAIVPFLLATLVNEIAISGAQVPNDTIVRATSILGTLHFIAMDDALSTKVSLALMIAIKPITKNIYLSINITTFLFIIAKYSLQKKIDFAV